MMKKITASAIVATVISGCAFTPPEVQNESRLQAIATIPKCSSDKECEVKWSAARAWILKNAGWQIKLITNDFIETYGAVGGSPTISVRVIKEPMQDSSYRFNVTIWCDNMFGCVPDQWESMKNMHNYVNSSWHGK